MIRFLKYILVLLVLIIASFNILAVEAQQRFPKPEFSTGYSQPDTTAPSARFQMLEYLDVSVLLVIMLLLTWLILKKRSRPDPELGAGTRKKAKKFRPCGEAGEGPRMYPKCSKCMFRA